MEIKEFEPLFGNWYIDSFIGAGAFGKVYRIKREDISGTYYSALKWISIPKDDSDLKQLKFEGLDDESIAIYFSELIGELSKEMKLMNRLRGNSHIVSYEDHLIIPRTGQFGYDLFIKMELLTSFKSYFSSHNCTREDVIKLGIDICDALDTCQKFDIVHRDIKPDNVFVTDLHDFKLGDFGIARQLERTVSNLSRKGTTPYMPPEVYKGEPYNFSVDIYSLGLMMYQLLNDGRMPFLPDAPHPVLLHDYERSIVRRMRGEQLPPPKYEYGQLGEVVMKACRYEPKDRYTSPKQMKKDLQAICAADREAQYSRQGYNIKNFCANDPEDEYWAPSEESLRRMEQRRKEGNIDVVFCIDTSKDMFDTVRHIKNECSDFYGNLIRAAQTQGVGIRNVRVRLITFTDYHIDADSAVLATNFFTLPKEEKQFLRAVKSIKTDGKASRQQSGLEALAYAIRSKWDDSDSNNKQIIAVWTRSGTYPLGQGEEIADYPKNMAKDFSELSKWWGVDQESSLVRKNSKCLILFTPYAPYWSRISSQWDNIVDYSGKYPDEFHKIIIDICQGKHKND